MPYECAQGPHHQACLDREAFLDIGALIWFFLGMFFGVCGTMIDYYLDLGYGDGALLIPLFWTTLWGLATNRYLLYHRVTLPLPTWLAFGHPVTFGGVLPNVCDQSAWTAWPCLPRDWHKFMNTPLLHVLDKENWPKWNVVTILFFVACNLSLFTRVFYTVRNACRRNALKNDGKCEHLEAGAKLLELGDMEKL
jgi:hypothetical protein